jgi:hypothetical protein
MVEESASINLLFPTVVYQKDDSNLITKEVIKKSRHICSKYGKNTFITKCITTVETFPNILEEPEFAQIKKFVIQSITDYITFMGFSKNKKYEISGSWLNYYKPGETQEMHIHHDNMISAVFYIIANNQQDFYVRNPSYHQQPILPFLDYENEYNQNNVIFNTFPGKLILFMSSTFHGTMSTNKERLSLSFNVR